jgi:hypothetical protein
MELREQPWDNSNNFLRGHVSPLISRTRMELPCFVRCLELWLFIGSVLLTLCWGVGCKREEIFKYWIISLNYYYYYYYYYFQGIQWRASCTKMRWHITWIRLRLENQSRACQLYSLFNMESFQFAVWLVGLYLPNNPLRC